MITDYYLFFAFIYQIKGEPAIIGFFIIIRIKNKIKNQFAKILKLHKIFKKVL